MQRLSLKIEFNEEDKAYNVSFPNLSGCFTYGQSVEEAKENEKEALTGYLESMDLRKLKIAKPSDLKGKDIYYIFPYDNQAYCSLQRRIPCELRVEKKDSLHVKKTRTKQ